MGARRLIAAGLPGNGFRIMELSSGFVKKSAAAEGCQAVALARSKA